MITNTSRPPICLGLLGFFLCGLLLSAVGETRGDNDGAQTTVVAQGTTASGRVAAPKGVAVVDSPDGQAKAAKQVGNLMRCLNASMANDFDGNEMAKTFVELTELSVVNEEKCSNLNLLPEYERTKFKFNRPDCVYLDNYVRHYLNEQLVLCGSLVAEKLRTSMEKLSLADRENMRLLLDSMVKVGGERVKRLDVRVRWETLKEAALLFLEAKGLKRTGWLGGQKTERFKRQYEGYLMRTCRRITETLEQPLKLYESVGTYNTASDQFDLETSLHLREAVICQAIISFQKPIFELYKHHGG